MINKKTQDPKNVKSNNKPKNKSKNVKSNNKSNNKPKNVKPKKVNPYLKLMLYSKEHDKPSFEYTPSSGKDKGKCKLYVKKIIEFGPSKTKIVVYKFDKYC